MMRAGKLLAWALAILLALSCVCAAEEALDATWNRATGGASAQQWLDGALAEGAGSATDNGVLCLLRSGAAVDVSAYVEAAAARLDAGISNVNTRMRTALCLLACGAPERVPADVVDAGAGALGAMSWVWALHLLNNGAPSRDYTAQAVVDELLALQLSDGGWRVTGDAGDVDVTCMCLQALAGCDFESDALRAAINRALDFLSARQKPSGGFASMGAENAESAAQALIALSSLGIGADDARFTKGGRTPLDALLSYQLPDGGFAHLASGEENPTATMQALQALIALRTPGEAFYDFSGNPAPIAAVAPSRAPGLPAWKRWAFAAIGALTLAGAAFTLTRRRARGKRLIAVALAAAIAAGAVWCVRIDSAKDYYDPNALAGAPADGYVTLSIRCDSVAGRADDGSTPANGVILAPTRIPFAEGDSVFDALTAAARSNSIQLEYEGSESMAYIRGINYLYEFAYGDLSGWLYSVNGETLSQSCGSCPLRDGDEILWDYTTDLGGGQR